jgi:hypothetical protein
MASILGLLRKTLKRSTNLVRRVGKGARATLKRATNAVGLTTRKGRKGRKARRSSKRSSQRN